ncbi:carbohydrate ABC transporter permease [Paenibacillus alba]|uniref:Carbohydrate ABC transporter permease n=1 Tax=Paenibacillus alba TaxID=1197127 RepID=A0ABU6GF33_9BACL|nr:carbohydrate ABC transporter permease [Paenibacillus alba]MEC0232560.1 carbohydrate ABC transporter permease [Paenibacillus alba]NQX67025.1 carbohydrate ABC transporter permease [Paenibacillus alba]
MRNKRLASISNLTTYLLLIVISVLVLFPFFWMVTTALKEQTKIFMFPPQWWPQPMVWSNFADVFKKQPDFPLYFFNSLFIATVVTVGTCVFAALAGYAFAKLHFKLRHIVFLILLSGMMIPTEVTAIPMFIWFTKLQLTDTFFPLIVPPMLGAGGMFGVFLLRQFYITVPGELVEAAKIDGCSPWTTFWTIMLPISGPIMATLAIFTFLHSWDNYFDPLIFISSNHLFTLPVGLKLFTDTAGTEWHLLMAASVIATVPLLVVFFLAQKRFIESVALTGLK